MQLAHTDLGYEKELKDLRSKIKMMSTLVEKMIASSTESFITKKSALALETIENDAIVDKYELEIDKLCLSVLARRQPLGEDLRFVATVLKIVTDIERIGDMSTSIAEKTVKLSKLEAFKLTNKVVSISEMVGAMFHMSVQSFMNKDASLARKVIDLDDEVDDLYYKLVKKIISKLEKDKTPIEGLVHIQSVVKWLERMGDHSTNIAEQVIFMIEGKDIRHGSVQIRN